MLTKVTLDLGGGPPYQYLQLKCDGCGLRAAEKLPVYGFESHLLPIGWVLKTTHRPNWPGYALGYDLCPYCAPKNVPPSPAWEASWRARTLPPQNVV
jgi:hypothetical protein